MKERVAHYVRPNETTGTPLRHVFIDTEAHIRQTATGAVQSWRCGVAGTLNAEKTLDAPLALVRCETPEALWQAVSDHARSRKRTIVWAHNLAYDLRIARAFEILPTLGWTLTDLSLADRAPWCRWRKDTRSVVMVDSMGVFACGLDKLAADFGLVKQPLPDELDDTERWWARCETDVTILHHAIVAYLRWLTVEDLGYWQVTGAGQSWGAWRHRFMTHKVLVHTDVNALEAERRAMWTGRTEAWRHGKFASESVDEWDLPTAYANTARSVDLPCVFRGVGGPISVAQFRRLAARYALLADVTISTTVPTVPTLHDGHIVWPVGTFDTTLWDVEVLAALDDGAQVTVRKFWRYYKRPALKAWGDWIVGQIERPVGELPPWQVRVLKHWSRALIGRYAMRHARWSTFGTAPSSGASLSTYVDVRTGARTKLMQAGTKLLLRDGFAEGFHSVPAITGYVMAATRVRLWRLMQAAGLDNVLYVDTDSLLMRRRDRSRMLALTTTSLGAGLRVKRSWRGVQIFGPRQLVLGDTHRISGIARNAVRATETEWVGEVWQGLGAALSTRNAGSVRITRRRWRLRGVDVRRVHIGRGRTVAVRLSESGRCDGQVKCGVDGQSVVAGSGGTLTGDGHGHLVSDVEAASA